MKIYFAGNITVPREKILLRYGVNRLYSFHYHGSEGEFSDEYKYRFRKVPHKRKKD